jgi:geranylgeranyl pyrophosphate synthase
MLYTAAHMMDAVVDGDTPDAWWVDLGPPTAINIATALYAGSGLMLLELLNSGVSYDVVIDILYKFQYSILQMCAGQHLELTNTHLSLDEYWRIAGAKSGSFFALACYVGARLATDDPNLLTCFWDYGTYLGSLIQISDDAKDVWTSKSGECRSLSNPLCLLPIIYTFQVASDSEITHLRNALKDSARRPGEMESIRASLEKMGAGLYLITKAEEYRLKALRSLKRMNLHVSHYNKLEGIINQLGFKEPIK